MKVIIDKRFEKDTDKIKDKRLLAKIADYIETFQSAKNLSEIKNIKKLSGFDNYYRVKLADYRMGFCFINDVVVLERFLHRKEVYRYFP